MLLIVSPTSGFTLRGFADWLSRSDLDIDRALNLDGGSSTGLFLKASTLHKEINSLGPRCRWCCWWRQIATSSARPADVAPDQRAVGVDEEQCAIGGDDQRGLGRGRRLPRSRVRIGIADRDRVRLFMTIKVLMFG